MNKIELFVLRLIIALSVMAAIYFVASFIFADLKYRTVVGLISAGLIVNTHYLIKLARQQQ